MLLFNLCLMSKNNKKTGRYIYHINAYNNGNFYFCKFLQSDTPLKMNNIDVNEIEIIREIPKEYWAVNGVNEFIIKNKISI